MSQGTPVTIAAATVAEICANFALNKDAKRLLREGMNPREFAAALLESQKCVDAIEFMAHALPAREGIWWGCLCLEHALGGALPPPDRAAVTAAVWWVMRPGEENRAAAKAPADAAGPTSIAGILASAAFQTGGNVAPAGLPPMPPAPFASAKAVALAVKLASIKTKPVDIPRMQRAYVELAIEVAEGRFI